MKITDNITMLEIDTPAGFNYPTLIKDGNHLVLIDTSYPAQAENLIKLINDTGNSIEQLTEIVLTHQDIDHVGCVPELLKFAPKAKVIAYIEEVPYIDGSKLPIKVSDMMDNYDNLNEEQKAFLEKRKSDFEKINITVTQSLEDGEVLPICGGIEVVTTPGHTPGNVSFFLHKDKIIIAGDAANIEEDKLIGPNPVFTRDMIVGQESFEKLKMIDAQGIITHHCGYKELKDNL